jgi:hypothetical protein
LAQHSRDLLTPHPPEVDIADLQDVISALQSIVLESAEGRPSMNNQVGFTIKSSSKAVWLMVAGWRGGGGAVIRREIWRENYHLHFDK